MSQVQDAATMEGASIVDSDNNRSAVALVCDPNTGTHPEGGVSGGHGACRQNLAASSEVAVESRTIPTRLST